MTKSLTKIIIPLLLIIDILWAQDSTNNKFHSITPPSKITQIVVIGNKKTKDKIIKRQIDFETGNVIDSLKMAEIREKVRSLDLFNSVETYIEAINNDTILFVDVDEKIHVFPVPYFDIVDQDWSKLNIGLGIAHINLFGENQKLFVVGWLGYNPGFSLSYLNPWFGKNHYTLGGNLYKTKITNRLFPFQESHLGGSILFGRNLSLYTKILVSLKVDNIKLSENESFYSGNVVSHDVLYKTEGLLKIDYRNSIFYPTGGYYASLLYYYAFWEKQHQNYQNMQLDLRYYISLGSNKTLAFRTLGVRRSSHQPVNDFLLLGYEYRIRGYFDYISQGIWLNISSISYRFPIMPIRFLSLPPIWGNDLFRKVPFGVSMSIFADSGFLVDDFFKLNRKDFLSGFGAGLLFHMPYANVMRLDFALNDKLDNYNIIFLFGVAF